jgi:YfiR/HmsC-like
VALLRRSVRGFLIALLAAGVIAAGPAPTDSEVKAAFLCGFAEFVDWPSLGRNDPVTIGILGQDTFGPLLDETMKNRVLQTRPIVLKRISTLEEALRCQIVYVSASEKHRVEESLRVLGKASILTVSDIADFAERGGVIGFRIEQNRVRFSVNTEAADRAGLQISSRLLKLARLVPTKAKSGD